LKYSQKEHGIIITQTPFRISFFGGGTDFPEYFNKKGSSIIGTAIDKYIYVTLNSLDRFFEKRIRFSYSKLENVDDPFELDHAIVKCILNKHRAIDNNSFLDIHTYADLPSSSGVGSSSSFTVGMLNALYLLEGVYRTPELIAKEAISIERDELKEAGGWQDQVLAAYGGFNRIFFHDEKFRVEPIRLPLSKRRALEAACMMFFTGDTRSSSKIQEAVAPSQRETYAYLEKIRLLAEQGFEVLNLPDSVNSLINEFGLLLDQAWQVKRNLSSQVSNDKIDQMYAVALKAGALGGKLCGAGGGGFLLLIVPVAKQESVALALRGYKQLKIAFEDHGSRVIYSKTCQASILAGSHHAVV